MPDAEDGALDGSSGQAAGNGRVRDLYRERVRRFQDEEDAARARSDRIGHWRVGVFLTAFGALVVRTFGGPGLQDPLLAAAGILGVVFLVLLWLHRRLRRRLARASELRRLNQEGLARLDRRWDDLPEPPVPGPGPRHAYADDLDLFGPASLLQLLSTVSTAPGRQTLTAWLLSAASPAEIRARQGAVEELAPEVDLRDQLAAAGRLREADDDSRDLPRFLEWAESGPWSLARPWLGAVAWGLPALTVVLGGLQLAAILPAPWWALPLAAQLWVLRRFRKISVDVARASAGEWDVRSWTGPLEVLAGHEPGSARLRELRSRLVASEGAHAPDELRRLGKLLHLADVRFSFFYPFLNPVLLWDLHVQRALDRWRRRSGTRVRGWIDAVGQAEALAALAALRFDHPDWCLPEVFAPGEDGVNEKPILRARQLGHPLLSPGECVRNDVAVGPANTFVLVTGSNMSGKSTLLRAIGVNAVLAQAGGPVCAAEMRLPPLELRTSMRVEDSLARGVSYFMAELQRLREIVAAARALDGSSDRILLYLLDEILQGTNTAERQIAARRILRHLLAEGAIGAVTTHDLTLADAPDLESRAHMVHFREEVREETERGPRISFDYRLRPGLATSTNALALMELVGLGPEGLEEEEKGDD